MFTQEPPQLAPFDPGLNDAIIKITRQLVPEFAVADTAPSTYNDLKAHLDAGKTLVVAWEGSDHTIFGAPGINHAFRAWHDWCHWQGAFDFSSYGEWATCNLQIQHLRKFFGTNAQTESWARLLIAEIIGQRQYFERYRAYIADQRAFVRAYLLNRDFALNRRW